MAALSLFFAAMTVSVASSPIFFRMVSRPFWCRLATYDFSGDVFLRSSMMLANWVRRSVIGFFPLFVVPALKEAVWFSCVAGDAAFLFY